MSKLNGIKMGAALLMLSSIANAAVVIDSQQIPSADIVSITISPNSGNMFITTAVGYEVKPVGSDPTPNAVAISSFSASPATFVEGGSTTVSWATQNAASCTPSGGTSAWRALNIGAGNGNSSVSISTPGVYAFTLTCTGSTGGTAVKNLSVEVAEEQVVQENDCPAAPLSGTLSTWSGFWKAAFPQPGYSNTNMSVSKNGYVALQFNTGNIVDVGSVISVGNTYNSGTKTVAISECPGNFTVPTACKQKFGTGGAVVWSMTPAANVCLLKAQTDYYLNVTFTDGFNANSTTCTTSSCIATMQHNNSNR